MALKIFVSLILALCGFGLIELSNSKAIYKNKLAHVGIVNGDEAVAHIVPEMVFVEIEYFNYTANMSMYDRCGGTLLSSKYVLTAAHCFRDYISVTVYAGAHNVKQVDSTVQKIDIPSTHIHMHKDFNRFTADNDIATLELQPPVDFNIGNVSTVVLPKLADVNETYVGEEGTIYGWGKTGDHSETSDVLRVTKYSVISQTECQKKMLQPIPINDTCGVDLNAQSPADAKATCNGDSGGPLYVGKVQVAITSFGSWTCEQGYPDAFVRVNRYFDWIQKHSDFKFQ